MAKKRTLHKGEVTKKRKQMSGGAKLKAAGRHAIMLGVSKEQLVKLRHAAALEMRPVSQFVTFYAIRAAHEVITLKGRTPRAQKL